MTDTGIPPYDEDSALRVLARGTRRQAEIADQLALRMQRHFSAEEAETAGRALLIGAASAAALAEDGAGATVVCNVLAFTAGRMIADGRARLGAQGGDRDG